MFTLAIRFSPNDPDSWANRAENRIIEGLLLILQESSKDQLEQLARNNHTPIMALTRLTDLTGTTLKSQNLGSHSIRTSQNVKCRSSDFHAPPPKVEAERG